MDIKINTAVTSQSNNTTPSQDTGPNNNGTAASRDAGNATTTDQVTLSESARLFESLANISTAHPAPDNQRIAELKQEISAGTFTIDHVRIAEKLHQFSMSFQ